MERGRSGGAEPRRRTGGRSARVVNGVLEATLDVLARTGYAALSFEDVAAKAGVSRTTIYRRWASKHDLVRAALLRFCEVKWEAVRDTGTLRGDLFEIVRQNVFGDRHERERHAGLLRALGAEFGDPELLALVRLARSRLSQPAFAVVERAVARGELPAGSDPFLVVDPVVLTLFFRYVLLGEEPDPQFAERLVDLVLAGARAGAAVRPRG
jgi:AcrR family transcriptional regulator